MSQTRVRFLAVLTALVLMLAGCAATPEADVPAGFAEFPERSGTLAISPEGVGFEIRVTDNEPEQDLAFWAEALERHMIDSGYLLYEQRSFVALAGEGTAFEWLAPVGSDDWLYLTAIVVEGDAIVIAEAAGPYEFYQEHRDDMLAALETISVDRGL
jgi:hypothetical protein